MPEAKKKTAAKKTAAKVEEAPEVEETETETETETTEVTPEDLAKARAAYEKATKEYNEAMAAVVPAPVESMPLPPGVERRGDYLARNEGQHPARELDDVKVEARGDYLKRADAS